MTEGRWSVKLVILWFLFNLIWWKWVRSECLECLVNDPCMSSTLSKNISGQSVLQRKKQVISLQNCIFHFRLSNYDKLQKYLLNPLLIKKIDNVSKFFSSESISVSRGTIVILKVPNWKSSLGVINDWPISTASPLVKQFFVVPFHHWCFSWLFKFLLGLHCSYTRKALISAASPNTILSHTRWFWNNSPVIKVSLWSLCKLSNQAGIFIPWCSSCVYSYYLHSALFKVTSLIKASKISLTPHDIILQ